MRRNRKKAFPGKELRAKTVAGWRRALPDAGERRVGCCDRARDVVVRMRGRHEARLVCRRGEIDARVEHRMEEAVEALAVARQNLVVAGRRGWREIDAEHATHRLRRECDTLPLCRSDESLGERARRTLERTIETRRLRQRT